MAPKGQAQHLTPVQPKVSRPAFPNVTLQPVLAGTLSCQCTMEFTANAHPRAEGFSAGANKILSAQPEELAF